MRREFRVLSLLIGLPIFLSMSATAWAAVIPVTTTADPASSGSGCSLREAVRAANTNLAVNGCPAGSTGDDTIVLTTGTYSLSLGGAGEDAAMTGDLDITDTDGTLTIAGAGSGLTIIDAADLATDPLESCDVVRDYNLPNVVGCDRVIDVLPNTTLTLEDLTLQHGLSFSGPGGAINNRGTLLIDRSVVRASASTSAGGAIENQAALTVHASEISLNFAGYKSCCWEGFGGGIHHLGSSITISDSLLMSNSSGRGGAIRFSHGGGSIVSTTILSNDAKESGGGIDVRALTSGPISIQQSAIVGNHAGGIGEHSRGGGITIDEGIVAIEDSVISGNSATATGWQNPRGGGIAVYQFYNTGSVDVRIRRSEISENSTVNSDNGQQAEGGGVYAAFQYYYWNAFEIENSTISNNTTTGFGGGLSARSSTINTPVASLLDSTIAGNAAGVEGGGVYSTMTVNANEQLTIERSLIANNTAVSSGDDCGGSLDLMGPNLIEIPCTMTGDTGLVISGVDPQLTDLESIIGRAAGSFTAGHALRAHTPLPGSIAIDMSDNATCPSADQRRATRPVDGMGDGTMICDLGAIEVIRLDDLFDTGADEAGFVMSNGSLDTHYVLSGAGVPSIVASPNVDWVTAPAGSAWIGPSDGNTDDDVNLTYTYTLTFDLTGFAPSATSIDGFWAADNRAEIFLNGVSSGQVTATYTSTQLFEVSSGFLPGLNTLEFVVTNDPGPASPNPSALLVSGLHARTLPVPEPGFATGFLVCTLALPILVRQKDAAPYGARTKTTV